MDNETTKFVAKEVQKMNIQGDQLGYVYFHELLFAGMKRIFGDGITNKKEDKEIVKFLDR